MNDTTIEPLTTEEIDRIRQGHKTYGIMVVDVPRVLATIDARDKMVAERNAEIARLRRLATKAGRYIATAARIIEEDSLSADEDDTADALEFAAELTEAGSR